MILLPAFPEIEYPQFPVVRNDVGNPEIISEQLLK